MLHEPKASLSSRKLLRTSLKAHNEFRAQVGVPPLVWNEILAKYAQEYAKKRVNDCKMENSMGPYGENLAGGYDESTIADSVRFWATEKPDYDPASGKCKSGGDDCLHYTQIVAMKTTSVGCAREKISAKATVGLIVLMTTRTMIRVVSSKRISTKSNGSNRWFVVHRQTIEYGSNVTYIRDVQTVAVDSAPTNRGRIDDLLTSIVERQFGWNWHRLIKILFKPKTSNGKYHLLLPQQVRNVDLSCLYSKVKIAGTMLCVLGALTLSLVQSTVPPKDATTMSSQTGRRLAVSTEIRSSVACTS
ncbi:gibberellin 20-oxidase-3 [Hibiscus syriacus]|uniref:Gibberellin 20-oxidase-3 n=1 Tax=Hibiscus syriacus TaxID=106335 RepID=A0A6A3BQ55_HIBSY|nr:gibberellin 20-oxidase-3 [Hibiscus syriacus]